MALGAGAGPGGRGNGNKSRSGHRISFSNCDLLAHDDVEIETSNGPIKAKKVTMRPFLHDKHAYNIGPNVRKVYEFTLSPEIPGEIYMIRTFVPLEGKPKTEAGEGDKAADDTEPKTGDGAESAEATIEETLVFQSATPKKESAAHKPNEERSEE